MFFNSLKINLKQKRCTFSYKWALMFVLSLWLVSCDDFVAARIDDEQEIDNSEMTIINTRFDKDYKQFWIDVKIREDIFQHENMVDSVVTTEMSEKFDVHDIKSQPKLVEVKNIKAQEIANMNLNILVLADMTLSEELIEAQKKAILQFRKLFAHDNIYVSFMGNGTVTESVLLTDYVLENQFVKQKPYKYLYRSILSKLDELNGHEPIYFPKVKHGDLWSNLSYKQKAIIVFSDEKVYQDNTPLDARHYELQQYIIDTDMADDHGSVYYVSFRGDEQEDITNEAKSMMKLLCKNTGGTYFDEFDFVELSRDILRVLSKVPADFQFVFTNPDGKVYRGTMECMKIECYVKGVMRAKGLAYYSAGSVYSPVVVNGMSEARVILLGILDGLIFILVLYLIFQFVIPFTRYCMFKKRHVTQYINQCMSLNGVLVEQSCYYCKAPFNSGDEIVAKCSHTLHRSCWNENEYKCPEYGTKCKTGSHYYNNKKLFDHRNASFYFLWLLAGALAGLIAWVSFTILVSYSQHYTLSSLVLWVNDLTDNSQFAQSMLDNYGGHIYNLPFYGVNLSFFLCLFLSIRSSHGSWLWKRLLFVVVKSILGGILGYLSFFIGSAVSILLGFTENSLLVDWIPWSLMGLGIAYIVAYGTDINLKRALIGAVISIIFGLGSMYLWLYTNTSQIDTRTLSLWSYMIYSIGLAITIAVTSPKSERYFLRVEGPIKTMDIAIYKWLSTFVCSKKITIGKSVNCNLQMSWDLNSDIAPEQAEVRMENGNVYLIALEDGVVVSGKSQHINTRKRLYHGNIFYIGQTKFTYVEKDV